MAQQCVVQRHSMTQYLVGKKTNNFNDLTVKIRLRTVYSTLHLVGHQDRNHNWNFGQSSAHPLSIDLIFLDFFVSS